MAYVPIREQRDHHQQHQVQTISLKDTRIGQVMNHKEEEEDAVIG